MRKAVIIALLLIAVVFGLSCGYRAVTAPWSIGLGGRATLTRSWVGPAQARQGAEYTLFLDLDYKDTTRAGRRSRSGRANRRSNLVGSAVICTPTGERYDYRVSGRADRAGKMRPLYLEYGDPKLSALNVQLTGVWQQQTVQFAANKNPFLPDGRFEPNRTLSSADPDDSFAPVTLRPGDRRAFDTACQRLTQLRLRSRAHGEPAAASESPRPRVQ